MATKWCPNGECVNFQQAVETSIVYCPMCAWMMEIVQVKKQSDRVQWGEPMDERNRA
jgi:uncharacterized Zn finger protein (UPF0148 family)